MTLLDHLRAGLDANISTMAEEARRCDRWGKSHHELDTALAEARDLLSRLPADAVILPRVPSEEDVERCGEAIEEAWNAGPSTLPPIDLSLEESRHIARAAIAAYTGAHHE